MAASQELISKLQEVETDLFAEFISYKYRHFHVQGLVFGDVHEFFDENTSSVLGYIDTIGEYLLSYHAMSPANLPRIIQRFSIPTPAYGDHDPSSLLQSGLDSSIYLKGKLTEIDEMASAEREKGLSNDVEAMISELDKLIYKYQGYLGVPVAEGR